jgi:ribosomal protein S18 acetylase RimI-like enzyme
MTVILESTMNAVSFYERLGFEVALKFDILLPPPGGHEWTELYEERSMVWRPATKC